jgi:X-X-X-Leu-X-X-Gly heptad repeat protein
MDDRTLNQLKGAGKMATGAARVIGGVVTATGHGVVGGFLRSHHMTAHAVRLGANSIKSGTKQIQDGLSQFNR